AMSGEGATCRVFCRGQFLAIEPANCNCLGPGSDRIHCAATLYDRSIIIFLYLFARRFSKSLVRAVGEKRLSPSLRIANGAVIPLDPTVHIVDFVIGGVVELDLPDTGRCKLRERLILERRRQHGYCVANPIRGVSDMFIVDPA